MALLFRNDLDRLLGGYHDVAVMIVFVLILITNNLYVMRRASRRENLSGQIVLIVENHLSLDEAICSQLKKVISDTEHAAMMLIREVHKLSEYSAKADIMSEKGFIEAQHTLQNELNFNFLNGSALKMSDMSNVVNSISSLQESHEDMRKYCKTLGSMVTEHNTYMAAGLGEILGHLQFQDGVRQRIERMEDAMVKRNELFKVLARGVDTPDADLLELPVQMRGVLDEYLSIECRHAPSSNNAAGQESLPKFELF
jgi:methyl-accepting chemotaxis protein